VDTRAKVFVATEDPSLAVSLLALKRDWDLQTGGDLDALAEVDIVVCDVATVESGRHALERLARRPRLGAVVVAQQVATDLALDDVAFPVGVVVRPYRLTELADAIDALPQLASSTTSGLPGEEAQEGWPPTAAGVSPLQPPGRKPSGEGDEPDDSENPDITTGDSEVDNAAPRHPIVRWRGHATAATTHERAGGGGWFDRHIRRSKGPEHQLGERLTRVAAATTDLEAVLDELPALASLPNLAALVLDEVVLQLAIDSAGFWQAHADGWHAIAWHGFTKLEPRMVVPFDQPLFLAVSQTASGLLIDPVDRAPATVAGIGGAHTESFMASPVLTDEGCCAIVAVGRNEAFAVADLDALNALTSAAAPAVSLAELLARIWSRAPVTPPTEEEPPPRSWRPAER
jgi:hypothetical protein